MEDLFDLFLADLPLRSADCFEEPQQLNVVDGFSLQVTKFLNVDLILANNKTVKELGYGRLDALEGGVLTKNHIEQAIHGRDGEQVQVLLEHGVGLLLNLVLLPLWVKLVCQDVKDTLVLSLRNINLLSVRGLILGGEQEVKLRIDSQTNLFEAGVNLRLDLIKLSVAVLLLAVLGDRDLEQALLVLLLVSLEVKIGLLTDAEEGILHLFGFLVLTFSVKFCQAEMG